MRASPQEEPEIEILLKCVTKRFISFFSVQALLVLSKNPDFHVCFDLKRVLRAREGLSSTVFLT